MNPARVFSSTVFSTTVLILIALSSSNGIAQEFRLYDRGGKEDPASRGTPSGDEAALKVPTRMAMSAKHASSDNGDITFAHMRFAPLVIPPHRNKEQPLRLLSMDGKFPQTNAPSVELKSTSAGYVVTVVYDHAIEYFYNHNSYLWIGKATFTLTDGDPVGEPDRYRVEFEPTRKNREPRNEEDAERHPPPPPVSGVVFEGTVSKSQGDIIVDVKCLQSSANASSSINAPICPVCESPKQQDLRITSPQGLATPDSQYLALEGKGTPNADIRIRILDSNCNQLRELELTVDDDGNWEELFEVNLQASMIRVIYVHNPEVGDEIKVAMPQQSFLPPKKAGVNYELLRKADIILTTGGPEQGILYGANYSHAALYIGGSPDGTPLIAEAVPKDEAGVLGQVRAAPLEQSTVWEYGDPVDFYRPISPLTTEQRKSAVEWAKIQTSRNLEYWNFNVDSLSTFDPGDFIWFYRAWNIWDSFLGRPIRPDLFARYMNELDKLKFSRDKFICSTLVWHSYYQATEGAPTWDLSTPNNAGNGGLLYGFTIRSARFLERLQPHFVFPDTMAQSGKLTRVN